MGPIRCGLLLFFLTSAAASQSLIQMVLKRPISDHSSGSGGDDDVLFCDSWRLSVETNNAGLWQKIPARCLWFVEGYMNGEKYSSDFEVIAGESVAFAKTVAVSSDGNDVWIFDIDETLLSNLPYYRDHGFGSEDFNETSWNEWVSSKKAAALPASLRLYEELQGLGFRIVLLTGRDESQRNATEENLLFAGYQSWERLILRY